MPFDCDPNGNVAAISDGATGRVGRGNRDMAYDALDRLMSASSPMFGTTAAGAGTAAFTEPTDTGPYHLVGRHGSATAAELEVPLLAAQA